MKAKTYHVFSFLKKNFKLWILRLNEQIFPKIFCSIGTLFFFCFLWVLNDIGLLYLLLLILSWVRWWWLVLKLIRKRSLFIYYYFFFILVFKEQVFLKIVRIFLKRNDNFKPWLKELLQRIIVHLFDFKNYLIFATLNRWNSKRPFFFFEQHFKIHH